MLLTGLVFIHLLLSSPGAFSRTFKSFHLPRSISQHLGRSHSQGHESGGTQGFLPVIGHESQMALPRIQILPMPNLLAV